jgi:hypothetical protein
MAPAGTPQAIVERLNAETLKALQVAVREVAAGRHGRRGARWHAR